jgi:hypothetical protein
MNGRPAHSGLLRGSFRRRSAGECREEHFIHVPTASSHGSP